jgi:AraC family ethanolamine operon transcriptional activator
MFKFIDQLSNHFEELSAMQFGWEAEFTQLGPAEQASRINLVQSDNAGICRFQFNSKFDQRMYVQPGYYSFGLLEPDTTRALVQGKTAPPGALIAFPRQEEAHGVSTAGFHGNGIHFKETYLEAIAETVLRVPLRRLVPTPRIYTLTGPLLSSLRGELYKWRQIAASELRTSAAMTAYREEALAIAVLNGLSHSAEVQETPFLNTDKVVKLVLDYVHSEPSEEITAVKLCTLADCSQRWLEHSFKKRFGVTPKKYVKYLRLSRLRENLLNPAQVEHPTVIELASVYGFWHMGQLAADYRKVYGELPSDTLKRS